MSTSPTQEKGCWPRLCLQNPELKELSKNRGLQGKGQGCWFLKEDLSLPAYNVMVSLLDFF
jgi:hypothetical protein